jgi:hypothetical protein
MIYAKTTAVAVISLPHMIAIPFFLVVAPGYWQALGPGSRLTLLLAAGLGAWGIYTSIGLLRRKRWARISVVTIAAAVMLLSVAVLSRRALDHATGQSLWEPALLLWEPALLSAISLAWILFFSAPRTKAFFATRID